MKINSYSFGNIVIKDKKYTNDVIIFPNSIKSDWWRKEGHKLHKEDLTEVIEFNPDTLIIGTGRSGKMEVLLEVKDFLKEKNIKVKIFKTEQAVKKYNKNRDQKTVAALHLTC